MAESCRKQRRIFWSNLLYFFRTNFQFHLKIWIIYLYTCYIKELDVTEFITRINYDLEFKLLWITVPRLYCLANPKGQARKREIRSKPRWNVHFPKDFPLFSPRGDRRRENPTSGYVANKGWALIPLVFVL